MSRPWPPAWGEPLRLDIQSVRKYCFAAVLHLQLAGYLFVLACGFAGLTLLTILWSRVRERLLLVMLVAVALFFLGLLLSAVLFYLSRILDYPLEARGATAIANLVITVFMYGALGLMVRRLAPESSVALLIALAAPVVGSYLVFGILPGTSPVLSEWMERNSSAVSLISVVSPSIFIAYCGSRIRASSGNSTHSAVAFLFRWLGSMLVGFAFASVVTTAVFVGLQLNADPTVLLNNLLFLGWNVVAIAAFIKHLVHPSDILDSGEAPPELLKQYGISRREAEVVAQISRGLSNKEVADRLNISFTTVRTHVYNIFQKTGAGSRVEMLRILAGKPDPGETRPDR